METNFSIKNIAQIAKHLRTYKHLFVTTKGQMFRSNITAEEAVRTLNVINDNANNYIGILPMDSTMVTDEKLKAYAKNTKLFDKLFDNAKIPLDKALQGKQGRIYEKGTSPSTEVSDSVNQALGLSAE